MQLIICPLQIGRHPSRNSPDLPVTLPYISTHNHQYWQRLCFRDWEEIPCKGTDKKYRQFMWTTGQWEFVFESFQSFSFDSLACVWLRSTWRLLLCLAYSVWEINFNVVLKYLYKKAISPFKQFGSHHQREIHNFRSFYCCVCLIYLKGC